ncbi:type II restriction enzyme [Fructobacillus fructosus]|uniref:type II restriction enzyme n=1 Tax=Fructobacillus fructosus TaxID=1631 RepID=UPI0040339918
MASKVSEDWEKIFRKYDILNKINVFGSFQITAQQIKEFHEPRLMTKFDWKSARPEIFQDNDLAILPNTRGTYVIGRFKAYQNLKHDENKPKVVHLPEWMRTFDNFPITSESVALNIASATGMIDIVLDTKDGDPLPRETITGRLKSGQIDYKINRTGSDKAYYFSVENAQVEIDGGYETLNKLAVIEAKNKLPEDFMIRQLYYPYTIYRKLNTGKEVVPIYMTHVDDIYSFHVFEFTESDNYSSIRKIKQFDFIVDNELDINIDELKIISGQSQMIKVDGIPFPQADSFTRILNLLKAIYKNPLTPDEIEEKYGFARRQANYYVSALIYLGLVENESQNGKYFVTDKGAEIAKLPNTNRRNKKIIQVVLNNIVFKEAFDDYIKSGGIFNDQFITKLIIDHDDKINSHVTANRRKSTVKSWLTWILSVAE